MQVWMTLIRSYVSYNLKFNSQDIDDISSYFLPLCLNNNKSDQDLNWYCLVDMYLFTHGPESGPGGTDLLIF